MTKQLDLVNSLAAEGLTKFSFAQVQTRLGTSSSATANTLRIIREQGLIDRISRGHYSIRPLGSLGTSAVSEDLNSCVAATFGPRPYRISYLSALDEYGLLTHPVRTVYVACTTQVRVHSIGYFPLKVVLEKPETIHIETVEIDGAVQSSLERALFEGALRIDLVGSVERYSEALAVGLEEADPERIARLSSSFGSRGNAALRRIQSMAEILGMPFPKSLTQSQPKSTVRLDPRQRTTLWIDEKFQVAWPLTIDEFLSRAEN